MIDAHVHFWDPAALDYPWLDGLPSLRRRFGAAELEAAVGEVPVRRVVFVEANARPDLNGREVRLAEAVPAVAGIVAFADVAALGAAALDTLPPSERVKGVRQNIQGQPTGFCRTERFVDGVREAVRRGLAFDLCATHDQLPDVVALVERCPETRFVLDHCGKPSVRTRDIDAWSRDLAALAAHEHVWCKLSGLLTEAAPGAGVAELTPYVEQVVTCFGPSRMLYGSDWPVVTLAGTYAHWYDLTRRVSASWTDSERAAFYEGNAARVYAL